MRYAIKKQLLTVVALATSCAGLLPVVFPQVAIAGKLVRECNQKVSPGHWTGKQRAVARIECYAKQRQEIIRKKNDLKRLKKAIDRIRGKKLPGTSEKYKCIVGVGENIKHQLGMKVRGTIYKVRFEVRGGVCSRYWNDARSSLKEYLRLYCHVGLPSTDIDVRKFKNLSGQYHKNYLSCFDRSIPKSIQDEYPITDRKTFKEYYIKMRSQWKDDMLGREYMNLSRACKRTLEGMKSEYPEYVRENQTICQ